VYYILSGKKPCALKTALRVGEYYLENDRFRVVVDPKTGCLISVYDKLNKREVLDGSGKGNVIQIFEDKPPNAPAGEPAWNMYLGRVRELLSAEEIRIVEQGPVRASIMVRWRFGDSIFTSYIRLYHRLPWVEFRLEVYWVEKYKTAKVAFPLSFENHWATYEIPFGAIQRYQYVYRQPPPAKMRMPARGWEPADQAKFEVPALRWIDMDTPDGTYGVSLLNDCKYGFDVMRNLMRMTILRGPRRGYPRTPEQWADQSDNPRVGIHVVHYALYPHKGDWRKASTVRRGYEFNYPLVAVVERPHAGILPEEYSFLRLEPDNLVLTALKRAEDSDDIIIRFYETSGRDANAKIKTAFVVDYAYKTDLIELDQYVPKESAKREHGTIELKVGHNEIVTLRVRVQPVKAPVPGHKGE